MPHIILVSRSTLYLQPGGDTVQVEQTAEHLRRLGVGVDIAVSGAEYSPDCYDLVHFFNLIRPADIIRELPKISRLFVSSIYVDYAAHERLKGSFTRRLLHALLGKFGVEYLKSLLRWMNGTDKFPGWIYLLKGHRRSINSILQKAERVITASKIEQELIRTDFPNTKINFEKVNLGTEHFKPVEVVQPSLDVANVARVEGIKNQTGLIEAVNGTSYGLDLFGEVSSNQLSYLNKCVHLGGDRINFKGVYTHTQLASALPNYRVHALPSFFETTGLASLEALSAGCSIVVSNHAIQKELFGDHAHYCEPSDPDSIRLAIDEAMDDDRDQREWVLINYSWEKAAREILAIYLKSKS